MTRTYEVIDNHDGQVVSIHLTLDEAVAEDT